MHANRYENNKVLQMADNQAQSSAGKSAIQLRDNRPKSVVQKKQVEAMANRQAVAQKKTSSFVSTNTAPIQMAGGSWKNWAAAGIAGLGAAAAYAGVAPILGAVGVAGGLGYLGYTAYRQQRQATAPVNAGRGNRRRRTAEDIIRRAGARGEKRRENKRFEAGRYKTKVGKVSVSGMNKQRIALTNMANYGGETMGNIPPYSSMQGEINNQDVKFIHDPRATVTRAMSTRERMAAVLSMTASNVSEEDKAPGIGKIIRAFARRYTATGRGTHPLSPDINPAVNSANAAREFMTGNRISREQREDIEDYASDSSDEDDDNYVTRNRMLEPDND